MTEAEKIIAQAKVSLIRSQPFFASILLRRPMQWIKDAPFPYAAIDAKANILLNEQGIESLSVRQAAFLLCHEVLHVAGLHFLRQGSRDHAKWNWSTDAWINETLKASGVGSFIPGGVEFQNGQNMTSETLYNQAPQTKQIKIGGIGADLPKNGNGTTGGMDPDSPEGKALANQIKLEVGQAANAARAAGKLSGELSKFVDQLIAEKIDWHTILSQYMTNLCKSPMQSWSRANKRFKPQGFYLPSSHKEPQIDFVVVQFDVSGSITKELMAKYISHVENILEACSPARTLLLWVDTNVKHSQEIFYPESNGIDHFVTYGGTDMEEGIRYVQQHESDAPDAFICITDGETAFTSDPGFPVIWCIDNPYRDVVAPYGVTIKIERDKE